MIALTRSSCSRATSSSPCLASSCCRSDRSSPRSSDPEAGARSASVVVPPAHPPTVLTSRAASTSIPPRTIKRCVFVCIFLPVSRLSVSPACHTCIKLPSTIARSLFLLDEMHVGNHHPCIGCFHHVVHSQQCDRDGRQCFHLDTGPANCSYARPDLHTRQRFHQARLDLDVIEAQGVAQRDQLRRSFRRQRSRDLAHSQNVALGDGLLSNLAERVRRPPDRPSGNRGPIHQRLVADVHHPGAAGLIHM